MHNPERMCFGQRLACLQYEVDDGSERQLRSRDSREIRTFEILEHDVRRTVVECAEVEHTRHVFAREPDDGLGLSQEALDSQLIGEYVGEQELQRHLLVQLQVRRLHDDPHSTSAQDAVHAILAREQGADCYAVPLRHQVCTPRAWK